MSKDLKAFCESMKLEALVTRVKRVLETLPGYKVEFEPCNYKDDYEIRVYHHNHLLDTFTGGNLNYIWYQAVVLLENNYN